jgi:hypothetical protein
MSLTFGVSATGGYGVLQSVTYTGNAEIAEARGTTGKVTDQLAYSITKEESFEGLFDGDTIANPGTSLTVDDVTGLITTVTKSQTNTDYQRVSGTVQKKDAATQVAYSS